MALTFYCPSGCNFKIQQQYTMFFVGLDKKRTMNQVGVGGATERGSQWRLPRTISALFGRRDSAVKIERLYLIPGSWPFSCCSAFQLPACSWIFLAPRSAP